MFINDKLSQTYFNVS